MKRAQATEAAARRRFQRRRIRVSVVIRTEDGKVASGTAADLSLGGLRLATSDKLTVGDKGIAQVSIAHGETVRADVEIVWQSATPGAAKTYGIRFGNLNGSERFALLEAIYAPGPGNQFIGGRGSGTDEAPSAAAAAAVPVAPGHHAYYMRLLRRIEQIHKLSPADTDQVLFARLYEGRSLRDALVDAKVINEDFYDGFMGAVYEVPFVDLKHNRPDPGVAEAVTASVASTQYVIPIERTDGKLVVAMADPLDLPTLDLLQMRNHQQVEVRFALIEDIETAIRDVYQGARLQSADRLLDMLPGSSIDGLGENEVEDLETLRKLSDATPIVSLVDSMLRSAVDDKASDIHLEPAPDKTVVRFRLDGVLHAIRTLPKAAYAAVVSRIKIMARMDITIRHVPQDGRASMRYARKDFDLRVSSIPTVDGEKLVIRLLEKNPSFKTLKAVGFNDANYELFAPLVRRPHGMILCCGPTGSGKSTTLFACLQEISDGTTNITTIEDPVEYRVPGVNQVEISVKRGLTFASVLRSLLRQDPDIIYVGEIRDRETADLAVRAALTGHLLLSTLHTNTAIQAIARLVDIGVDPALIGSSLIAVVGQRLVRKICDKCRETYAVAAEEALLLEEILPLVAPKKLQRGKGCQACHETGFRGRMPVHEVVVVDESLRRLIAKGADSGLLLDHVMNVQGFSDLRDDAVQRMLDGQTTLQEVMRMTV